jgi:adenylate kinase family enzyme
MAAEETVTSQAIPPLVTFGRRIMICGPSNSGKSTLARSLARALGVPAVHLDQLRHLENTDWRQRPDEDFARLHDAAVAGDGWVMDGNYSKLMPTRLPRATGIILLSDNRVANLGRYVRRTLFEKHRPGNLEGAADSLKWNMVHWIWVASPMALRRYREDLPKAGLPFMDIRGMRDLNRLYAAWNLTLK